MAFTMRAALVFLISSAVLTDAQNDGHLQPVDPGNTNSTNLPVVDLGYELHKASYFNSSGQFYNFSNIRYAAPPTKDNRFRAPLPPAINRSVIRDGSQGRMCPQAIPSWGVLIATVQQEYLAGQPINVTQGEIDALNNTKTIDSFPTDPRETEDCLFLDVVVPQSIFANAKKESKAPVLVWIFGGGYTQGDKSIYNPSGLFYRSEAATHKDVVFVALNYRLGAFGWSAGPTVQADGDSNAGLLDQRMALEWVQQHIHKFGGDPNRVTVFGQSAGGGSIMHQLTAYGGSKSAPFQQAISQSAAFQPYVSNASSENILERLMSFANVTSLNQLRQIPFEQLARANKLQVGESPYGASIYGPVVDGSFVPALPGVLLFQGRFNKNVTIMTGKNSNEGLTFADPAFQNNTEFTEYLEYLLPTASPSVIQQIEELYPPPPHNQQGFSYADQMGRVSALLKDVGFACNSYFMDKAYAQYNKAYGYYFSIPPGIHGQDVVYTFYNNGGINPSELLTNVTAAETLQDYIITFAMTGHPSAPDIPGLPAFDVYGTNEVVTNIGQSSITRQRDPQANPRCEFWQKAPYA